MTDAQTAQAVTLRFTAKTLADGELFEKNQLGDAYIACLCEDGDQLGQWRGYGANVGVGRQVLPAPSYSGPPQPRRAFRCLPMYSMYPVPEISRPRKRPVYP
ncbi:hypothetical protein SAMN05444695_10285 [Rhodococcus triatomae]|uniref:Uncharacterized protein n=1 Tax=Rhodococcus triatomae TaxID=300028 RepID=A0A1G8CR55_9NOCA|nr:hypothetical protein SAMN05444695_10285 [Rhodococcus triatomae]